MDGRHIKVKDMKVKTYSKDNFVLEMKRRGIDDNTVDSSNEYFICIDSTGGPWAYEYFLKPHSNVIREVFDDTPIDTKKWGPDVQRYFDAIAMTYGQAERLAKFIKNIPSDSSINIYCAKGISRSNAIMDFIEEEYLKIPERTARSSPSGYEHIKKLLRHAWTSL